MRSVEKGLRHLGAGGLAFASLLVSGCFMAAGDQRLIDQSVAVHPFNSGSVRICLMDQSACRSIAIVKSEGWGYEVSLPDEDEPFHLVMMKLTGAGVPPDTYLTEASQIGPGDYYQLGLARRESDGGWTFLQPECTSEKIEAVEDDFSWVLPKAAGTGQICWITAPGLTPARLYDTLSSLTDEGEKFRLFAPG